MKNNINTESNYIWTELKVEVDRANKRYRVTPLNGVYPIELDDTNGMVREYFENDLIDGPDRFLVAVWEVGEYHYNFELIMKTDIPEAIFEYIYPVAEAIINQNISEPAVITFR